MPTKSCHGVTLWAVPRFHRSDIASMNIAPKEETGAEWVTRLKTYSFSLCETSETAGPPVANLPDHPEFRH
jgi:hypothetical protein